MNQPSVYDIDTDDEELVWCSINCYDTILQHEEAIDDCFIEETLYHRSQMEYARHQLNDEQNAFLDKVDSFWKAHPREFNLAFRYHHGKKDVKNELKYFLTDQYGNWPAIPSSHWWWWPIEMDEPIDDESAPVHEGAWNSLARYPAIMGVQRDTNDGYELLYVRDDLEYTRHILSANRQAILDAADAFWKLHAKEFNAYFRHQHERREFLDQEALKPDNHEPANVFGVPRSHWWWWPI